MSWQPTLTWKDAQKRAEIIRKIRQFFVDRNVLEVETPALSQGTVTDVHLDAFNCHYDFFRDSSNQQSKNLYLQTSPEFHMKRLLAAGYDSIFQIAKAYRHEEFGQHHNPEFTLLEWYRLGFDHFQLMDEVSQLLKLVLGCTQTVSITYQNIFIKEVGLDPLIASREELLAIINRYNKIESWLIKEKNNDILLQFIFSEIIEPVIDKNIPCFVYNFPKSQASLAKICSEDNRVSQRFECYYQGLELANGFNELTDSKQQLLRFQEDNKQRKVLGNIEKPIEHYFISALEHGLPRCSGVALGIDRLVMIALNKKEIKEVISFSIDRA